MQQNLFYRTRRKKQFPTTISVGVGYANGGGFRKQFTEKQGFKNTTTIIQRLWRYICQNADQSELYRTLGISFTNFRSNHIQQMELFKSEYETKTELIDYALDDIKLKYGKDIVMRAKSLTKSGTLQERKGLIAGHKA